MSVLHVTQPTTEGVGHHVREAVADQSRRGWSVTLAAPSDVALEAFCDGHGVTRVRWDATRGPSAATGREIRLLHRIMQDVAPDVVHLHSSKAGLAGRLALRGGRPTMFTPHAWSFLHGGAMTRLLAMRWERIAARWANVIVCVSEAERDLARARGIDADLVVLRNAVDLERYAPLSIDERRAVRAALGVGDAPVAVCVGRLARQKGQDVLLEAWPTVHRSVPDATLLLVGDGPDREELAARRTPGVQLLGTRDDVPALLGAADVAVLPSRWEGASYVLLEAMACGASVVATDVPGTREALPDDGGAVVAVGEPRPLADAIATRLSDLRRAHAEGAVARDAARAFDARCWGDALATLTEAAAGAR
jgi:glycosyltransferase involved in cell wall biosynthesis